MIRWSIPAAVSPRVRRDQSLHLGRARAAAREARRAHLADASPPDLGGLGGRAESQSPLRRPGTAAGLPLAAPDRRRPHARSPRPRPDVRAARDRLLRRRARRQRTGFVRLTSFSISTVTSSPAARKTFGSRKTPTHAGVPVAMRTSG